MLPPALSSESSQALLERARAGDKEALDGLILGHMRYVTSLAARLCFVPQFLDEAVSIATVELVKAVNKIPQGAMQDHENVTAYIRMWVKGRVLREIRKYVNGRGERLQDIPYEPRTEMEEREEIDRVTVTAMECQIVNLSALGYTMQEIANRVNRSMSYVAGVKASLLQRFHENIDNERRAG